MVLDFFHLVLSSTFKKKKEGKLFSFLFAAFQVTLTQNNLYAKVTYFGMPYCHPSDPKESTGYEK